MNALLITGNATTPDNCTDVSTVTLSRIIEHVEAH